MLPLLDRQGLVLRDTEPYHLALSVERIEIDMGNDSQRTGCGRQSKLPQLPVSKPGFATLPIVR